jgi:hypothetical protein
METISNLIDKTDWVKSGKCAIKRRVLNKKECGFGKSYNGEYYYRTYSKMPKNSNSNFNFIEYRFKCTIINDVYIPNQFTELCDLWIEHKSDSYDGDWRNFKYWLNQRLHRDLRKLINKKRVHKYVVDNVEKIINYHSYNILELEIAKYIYGKSGVKLEIPERYRDPEVEDKFTNPWHKNG